MRPFFCVASISSLVSLAALAGCGNEVDQLTGGSGGAGSSTTSTASSTGTAQTSSTATGTPGKNSGDCDGDADCPPNGHCVELTPGGFRVCQYPTPEATSCDDPMNDTCCSTAECKNPGEKCLPGPILPSCGGPQILPHNECAADLCATDKDCDGPAVCAPADTVGSQIATCLYAPECKHDTDCSAHPGGICATVQGSCCNAAVGLFCIYPGINCRSDADCESPTTKMYCGFDENASPVCLPGSATCPV
ncbi:MAG: hypothetical protein U0414_01675 [Polyangiaceae bacterium]